MSVADPDDHDIGINLCVGDLLFDKKVKKIC